MANNILGMKFAGNIQQLIDGQPGHEYMINVEIEAASGASAANDPVALVGSMPFAWEELGAHWNTTDGDWEFKITDMSDNVAFSSEKIQLTSLVGDDKQPYVLKHPWIFSGGAQIYVEATNNGTGTDKLYLTFIGKRLTTPQQ